MDVILTCSARVLATLPVLNVLSTTWVYSVVRDMYNTNMQGMGPHYTAPRLSLEGWALVNRFNPTSGVTAVTPTDRHKSIRNRCVIKVFCGVFNVVTLLVGFFCGCRGFFHRTEPDLFLFRLSTTGICLVIRDGYDTHLQGMGPHYSVHDLCFVHCRGNMRYHPLWHRSSLHCSFSEMCPLQRSVR